jgi:ubiquinone biosynthesis protein
MIETRYGTGMLDWKTLCRSLDSGALVPEQFAAYRQPVADALSCFLENLSVDRQAEILADQIALPATSPVGVRLVSIARHSPILQKLGQLLARDRRLTIELRRLLQGLESAEPTISGTEVRAMIQRELGDLNELGVSLAEEPIAEASMAVVIPFQFQGSDLTHRGVFKLLKPNIQQYLAEESKLLTRVGLFLDERCEHYGIPRIDYEGLFAQVRELLSNEVDLRSEQQHMREARETYANSSEIVVPELFPFCTARVTAMQRVDGQKITQLTDESATVRRRIARRLIDALVARPIWSAPQSTLFHADPHAGNLLLTDDHKLAILDWGLVGRLTKQQRVCVSQLMIGAITLDASLITRCITALSDNELDRQALAEVVDDALHSVRWGQFPGIGWLTSLMDDAVTRANASFPADLLLFRKALLILDGVIADISEDCTTDNVLAVSFAIQLGIGWRDRLVSSPFTRRANTHLSNFDLVKLLGSGPKTAVRYWTGLFRDLFNVSASR